VAIITVTAANNAVHPTSAAAAAGVWKLAAAAGRIPRLSSME
jgi:hypothetical protein